MRAAFAALALLVLAASAGASTQTTRVTIYRPFAGGRLAPSYTVTGAARGYCWTGSIADERSDAWRCLVGNVIHDPCFSDPAVRTWVACADTPFARRVLRLNLTKPLPRKQANRGSAGHGQPWALKLPGGTVCTAFTGATWLYHGLGASYGCTDKAFLAGAPNRSKPTWTIVLGTSQKAPPRTAVILEAVW